MHWYYQTEIQQQGNNIFTNSKRSTNESGVRLQPNFAETTRDRLKGRDKMVL